MNVLPPVLDDILMYISWKEVFTQVKKIKEKLVISEDNNIAPINTNTFVNHFLLQLFVLWALQKQSFFNQDQNYFQKVFRSIKEKTGSLPYRIFYNFLVAFLEKLENLDDYVTEKSSSFGTLRGCSSAIFIDLGILRGINAISDEFFSISIDQNDNGRGQFVTEGVLDLLENISFEIDGFFLGSLHEWLIATDKRKRSGIYYTPRTVASYASRHSIKYWLSAQFDNIFKNSDKISDLTLKTLDIKHLFMIYDSLVDLTILDPAVGTGHFLESTINELLAIYSEIWMQFRNHSKIAEYTWFIDSKNSLFKKIDLININDSYQFEFIILSQIIFPKTIYGVDISNSAIAFTKARFFLILSKRLNNIMANNSPISPFYCNLKCADALLINYKSIYPQFFDRKKGFSVILTNPPYIGESDNKELFRIYARKFPKYYEGKLDIWYLFFHLALDLLESDGIVSILASSYWLTASGASKLRERVMKETYIIEYINFGTNQVFESAQGVHTNLITVKKLEKRNSSIKCTIYNQKLNLEHDLMQAMSSQLVFQIDQNSLTLDDWDNYFHFCPPNVMSALRKIVQNAIPLEKTDFYVKEGLITGLNRITRQQVKKYGYPKAWTNNGVFILNEQNSNDQQIIKSLSNEDKKHVKPLYKNSDINRYSTHLQTSRHLLYIRRNKTDLTKTPNIAKHLEYYRKAMENSLDHPPFINRPRQMQIFVSPKIVVPQRTRQVRFGYSITEWFAGQDVYYILTHKDTKAKLRNLLVVFHSKLAYFWFSWMGKKKGLQFEFFGESISYFPISKNLEHDSLLTRLTDYLIFLYSLQDIPPNIIPIREFFDEVIVNLLVYQQYLHPLIEEIKDLTQSLNDVRNIIEKSVNEVDLEQFLRTRYQLNRYNTPKTKTELENLKEQNLTIIVKCYNILNSNPVLDHVNKQVRAIPIINHIETFYSTR